jgi:hypothetical protein
VPIVDTIPRWIDHRVMVTPFNAAKTLTRDTVPVDADAALEVEDYRSAIAWAAQTALREIIGQMELADILGESEEQISASFQRISLVYADNPTALHLRAMNMLFEGLEEKGAMIIVPSDAVDTMNLGGIMGMASFGQEPAEPVQPQEGKARS